jgi:DNA-directed RNA polymerase subunit RPC12/RpoP
MARLKLFSENPVRRKLFSEEVTLRTVVCEDCGFELKTAQSASSILCPKCGGTRFNIKWETEHEPYKKEVIKEENPLTEDRILDKNRRSLFLNEEDAEEEFQRSFSAPDNEYEKNLSVYSGKRVNADSSVKLFGIPADEMEERGFGRVEGKELAISPNAYLQSRLFSKLIVSVTKVMDLDPKVTCCGTELGGPSLEDKERIIESLSKNGSISPKGIIIIKKAHGIVPISQQDSDIVREDCDDWCKDSGILNDLKLEFGGSSQELPTFESTLNERYPDAPSNILDLLKKHGVITLTGSNKVNIL